MDSRHTDCHAGRDFGNGVRCYRIVDREGRFNIRRRLGQRITRDRDRSVDGQRWYDLGWRHIGPARDGTLGVDGYPGHQYAGCVERYAGHGYGTLDRALSERHRGCWRGSGVTSGGYGCVERSPDYARTRRRGIG